MQQTMLNLELLNLLDGFTSNDCTKVLFSSLLINILHLLPSTCDNDQLFET